MRPLQRGSVLLFDLESDPSETRNVGPKHPDAVARMQSRVDPYTTRHAAKTGTSHPNSEVERRRPEALGDAASPEALGAKVGRLGIEAAAAGPRNYTGWTV
jgi:hypothetical protein